MLSSAPWLQESTDRHFPIWTIDNLSCHSVWRNEWTWPQFPVLLSHPILKGPKLKRVRTLENGGFRLFSRCSFKACI